MSKRLIVALDVPSAQEALALVEQLHPLEVTFKVGMQLFYQARMPLVQEIQARGGDVFLDLKLHDIPNTVGKASETLVRQGVVFFNVHAQGGLDMMRAAGTQARATAEAMGAPRPLVIAVTLLTSLNESQLNQELQIPLSAQDYVEHLACLAQSSGLDGVVCSAQEASRLRAKLGPNFVLVTPGIRPSGAETHDQARILTPTQALKNGSDFLVVGRPITQASQPVTAAKNILEEMQQTFSRLL